MPDDVAEVVHAETHEGITTITLDSPHNRNALSQTLLDQLARRLDEARDESVRGVVLTAAGTTFCSGADLKDRAVPGPGRATLPEILTAIWELPKAVVVKLNGHVRAGGTGLVAAADIAVAPRGATFAFSEVRIGVAPAVIAVMCTRRMQPRALARYMLTGEVFGADEAADSGLVTMAVDREALDVAVDDLAAALRLTEPTAVRETKALMRSLPTLGIAEGFDRMETLSNTLFESEAAAEGMLAFREKRPPRWAQPS